ncbi:hypothetical protein niasHT_019131 [Heterodera trifolii]|uniref:Phosphotransferase n=1 Tax=Heterodera trifolii TaxID=157864 RepID=A0ABD2L093_9BILA
MATTHQHNPTPEVKELGKCLALDDNQLRDIMAKIEMEYKKGLDPVTAPTACVKMLLTYIRAIAVGEEKGEFLALDLGGTNFRVLRITLEGGCRSTMHNKIYSMPDSVQQGTGTEVTWTVKKEKKRQKVIGVKNKTPIHLNEKQSVLIVIKNVTNIKIHLNHCV